MEPDFSCLLTMVTFKTIIGLIYIWILRRQVGVLNTRSMNGIKTAKYSEEIRSYIYFILPGSFYKEIWICPYVIKCYYMNTLLSNLRNKSLYFFFYQAIWCKPTLIRINWLKKWARAHAPNLMNAMPWWEQE